MEKKCEKCRYRSEECDRPDGALVALLSYWGTQDRDCLRDMREALQGLEKRQAKD